MSVYLIQVGEPGPVKIGKADDVQARLRELQCANPHKLAVIRILDGGHLLERALHRHYEARRLQGEWFEFCSTMLVIELAPISPEDRKANREGGLDPADRVIKRFGGAQAMGELLSLHRSQVHRWRLPKDRGGCDGEIPRVHHVRLVELARQRGIALTTSDLIPWLPLADEILSEAREAA